MIASHWGHGGRGALQLAHAVARACAIVREAREPTFRFLYPLNISIKQKIETICREIYGADSVEYSDQAEHRIEAYTRAGYDIFPICIAKTQYSLSTDPALKGVPVGFTVKVRELRAAVGAGYIYPICGDIMTVPGLTTRPGFYDVDIDMETGRITGLF